METNIRIAQFNSSTQCQTYNVRIAQLFEDENLENTSKSSQSHQKKERKVYKSVL